MQGKIWSLVFGIIMSPLVIAQDVTFSTTEVKPGLFVLQGKGGFTGGNVAISVGEDGIIMIDDAMPPFISQLKSSIAKIADKPIDFLINTHIHGDHTGNNATFADNGAHIVAHENMRLRFKEQGQDTPDGKKPTAPAALPVITFATDLNFYLNGGKLHVFHLPNAHTDGDAVIYFEDINVLHTGDTLFNSMFPFIDLDNGGSVEGYIDAQKRLYEMADAKTIVIPGHGAIGNREALKASYTMLKDARAKVMALVAQGKSEQEVLKLDPLAELTEDWSWNFITTEKMTQTLYRDIAKDI